MLSRSAAYSLATHLSYGRSPEDIRKALEALEFFTDTEIAERVKVAETFAPHFSGRYLTSPDRGTIPAAVREALATFPIYPNPAD